MQLDQAREVLVHPKHRTVHEIVRPGKTWCGNGKDGNISYLSMQANETRSGDHPCQGACVSGRRMHSLHYLVSKAKHPDKV